MICSINGIVQQMVQQAQQMNPQTIFTTADIIEPSFFDSLSASEKEYIEEKFRLMIVQDQVMGVELHQATTTPVQYKKIY